MLVEAGFYIYNKNMFSKGSRIIFKIDSFAQTGVEIESVDCLESSYGNRCTTEASKNKMNADIATQICFLKLCAIKAYFTYQ